MTTLDVLIQQHARFTVTLVSSQDVHSQGEVIACLEKALVRQAEQLNHVHSIKEECQKAILRVAELSSDDFHLDRHLYFACRDDRERFCQNVRDSTTVCMTCMKKTRETTFHCLMLFSGYLCLLLDVFKKLL